MNLATRMVLVGTIASDNGTTAPSSPTNITISNASILDNAAAATVVGTLSMVGGALPATFNLVSPSTFAISGANLVRSGTGTITPGSVNVVVNCTDNNGLHVASNVTIPVSVVDHSLTMSAVLSLYDGTTATFDTGSGTELDTYTNPYSGTVTRTIAAYSASLPFMRVMFRIDGAGTRYSIRFDWGEALGTYGNPGVIQLPPYTAQIYINGVLTDTITAPDPTGNSSHHWWGASHTWESSAIPILKTGAQIKASGYAWDFDSTQPGLRALPAAWVPYTTMNYSNVTRYMPTTGGRDDIGLVPAPVAAWLATDNATQSANARKAARASRSFPWNYWDRNTHAPIDMLNTYPAASFDGRQYLSGITPQLSVGAPLLGFSDFDSYACRTSIIAEQSATLNTPLTINGSLASAGSCVLATHAEAFTVQLICAGANFTSTVFRIVGTAIDGSAQTENINGGSNDKVVLTKRWRSITSATPTVSLPGGGTVYMGIYSYEGTPQAAHCPNLCYVEFLRTGHVEDLEQHQFATNWLYRSDPYGHVASEGTEIRGAAWMLNHIFGAAKALQLLSAVPNYLLPASYWNSIIAANATDLMTNFVGNASAKTADFFSGTSFQKMSFWQEEFLLGVFITAVEWGWSGDWITIRDWKLGNVLNRYTATSHTTGWPRSRPLTSSGYADDNSWLGLTTWAQLAAAQSTPIVETVSGDLATDLDNEYPVFDRGNLVRLANNGNAAAATIMTWFEPQIEAQSARYSIMWQWAFKL